jgi:hypothetical protein
MLSDTALEKKQDHRILGCWNNGDTLAEALAHCAELKHLKIKPQRVEQAYCYLQKNYGERSVRPAELHWL